MLCHVFWSQVEYKIVCFILQRLTFVITHWEKLLDSDWLSHCEFIRNLRANSVIRGNLQISRAKSVIHSE